MIAVGAACAGAAVGAEGMTAQPAYAFNPIKPICDAAGLISGIVGKACSVVQHGGQFLSAGKKLLGGHVGGALKTVLGEGGSVAGTASAALGLAAVVTWVLGGAKYALGVTAHVLGETTTPQLRTTWFSSTYWRVAAIAAVLTLPFLFAAAIQALLQSDLLLLIRAVGYLPLAMLAVGIATPLTTLLLAASDQLSVIVSSAAGNASGHFLDTSAHAMGGVALISASPFLVFFAGLLTVAGAFVLWVELLVREAAVYVIVLMLPLAFAALVWPARRTWAIRAVELLVALILSKFAIVAVLSLGGAALGRSALHSVSGLLAGFVLLVIGAFAPWALLRLLPLTELASGAAGSLRADAGILRRWAEPADAVSRAVHDLASAPPMQREKDAPEPPGEGTDGAHAATDGLVVPEKPSESEGSGPGGFPTPPGASSSTGAFSPGGSLSPTEGPSPEGGPSPAGHPTSGPSPIGGSSPARAGSRTAAASPEEVASPAGDPHDGATPPATMTGPHEPPFRDPDVDPSWAIDDLDAVIDLTPGSGQPGAPGETVTVGPRPDPEDEHL